MVGNIAKAERCEMWLVFNFFFFFLCFAGVDARYIQSTEFPGKLTLLLTDLKPWAGHQFRVRAINQYGMGAPSIPTGELLLSGFVVHC